MNSKEYTLPNGKKSIFEYDDYGIGKVTIECMDELMSMIADQTRKKGKWIFSKTIFDRHGCTVECSACHKKWKTYDEIRWVKENKFCPNCGEPKESED